MEIVSLAPSCFKIRTKEAVLLVESGKVVITSSKNHLPFEITAPGEYEVSGVSVFAYKNHPFLVFLLVVDGLTIIYADNQSDKLPEELFDQIDEVVVLFASASESALVNQAEPRYVVLTQLGESSFLPQDKLVIQAGRLPEERQVVVLNARSQNSASLA